MLALKSRGQAWYVDGHPPRVATRSVEAAPKRVPSVADTSHQAYIVADGRHYWSLLPKGNGRGLLADTDRSPECVDVREYVVDVVCVKGCLVMWFDVENPAPSCVPTDESSQEGTRRATSMSEGGAPGEGGGWESVGVNGRGEGKGREDRGSEGGGGGGEDEGGEEEGGGGEGGEGKECGSSEPESVERRYMGGESEDGPDPAVRSTERASGTCRADEGSNAIRRTPSSQEGRRRRCGARLARMADQELILHLAELPAVRGRRQQVWSTLPSERRERLLPDLPEGFQQQVRQWEARTRTGVEVARCESDRPSVMCSPRDTVASLMSLANLDDGSAAGASEIQAGQEESTQGTSSREVSRPMCSICMDGGVTHTIRPCGHVMCGTCVGRLISSVTDAPRCPFCRKVMVSVDSDVPLSAVDQALVDIRARDDLDDHRAPDDIVRSWQLGLQDGGQEDGDEPIARRLRSRTSVRAQPTLSSSNATPMSPSPSHP